MIDVYRLFLQSLFNMMYGNTRNPEKSPMKWVDVTPKTVGKGQWRPLAGNRDGWKEREVAYIQKLQVSKCNRPPPVSFGVRSEN